jgi:hypothetical protein
VQRGGSADPSGMWKPVLIVLLLVAAGHVAVRYLRTNPLDPVVDGGEVVVETNEYEVRFAREGPAGGVYLIAAAHSDDFTNQPQNASLAVLDLATARAYLQAYPDFRRYGSPPGVELANVSSTLAVVASNRIAYGNLLRALSLFERRATEGGERLCVQVSGESLAIASAVALSNGSDHTAMFARPGDRAVFADKIRVDDCSKVVAQSS